jgi:hypothetical protein
VKQIREHLYNQVDEQIHNKIFTEVRSQVRRKIGLVFHIRNILI